MNTNPVHLAIAAATVFAIALTAGTYAYRHPDQLRTLRSGSRLAAYAVGYAITLAATAVWGVR